MEARAVDLIALASVEGLGPRRLHDVLARFGSADAALRADTRSLEAVPGIGPTLARAIARADTAGAQRHLDRTRELGGHVLLADDPRFPALVREIPDPPAALFVLGRSELLAGPCVSVVGSRKPTTYGARVARRLAAEASHAGLVVVSGMARGIDAIAHREALAAGAGTVAILGTGVDIAYPAEHRALHAQIARDGCLVSEHPPGVRPRPGGFQSRNRLISGMAPVLVVVEAGPRSGTSITAGCAAEQGRTVLAVPGPITASRSWGTNRLIRDGAKPYLEAADLIEEYVGLEPSPRTVPSPHRSIPSEARSVWHSLDSGSRHVDELAEATGLGTADLLRLLSMLEVEGFVRSEPGMHFARVQ